MPDQWASMIMPELSRRSKPLAALMQFASGVQVKGSLIEITFPQSKAFARSGADTPANKKLLSQVLAMAAGGTVNVSLTTSTEPEPEPAHEAEPEHQATLSEDEFLTHVKDTFDAREIEEPQR